MYFSINVSVLGFQQSFIESISHFKNTFVSFSYDANFYFAKAKKWKLCLESTDNCLFTICLRNKHVTVGVDYVQTENVAQTTSRIFWQTNVLYRVQLHVIYIVSMQDYGNTSYC